MHAVVIRTVVIRTIAIARTKGAMEEKLGINES